MTGIVTTLAAAAEEDSGGSFLVKPGVGLMIWTLFVFVTSMIILKRAAWPRIAEVLDKRQHAIEESIDVANRTKDEGEKLLAQTRRDIEAETRRAIQEIRREVADLTVLATEKVTRKVLTEDDQRRLVEEALGELDFDQLSGQARRN